MHKQQQMHHQQMKNDTATIVINDESNPVPTSTDSQPQNADQVAESQSGTRVSAELEVTPPAVQTTSQVTAAEQTTEVSTLTAADVQISTSSNTNRPTTQTIPRAEQSTDNTSRKKTTICRFYDKGSCMHGLAGKDCKYYLHPEICRKFSKHGTRQPRRCNQGQRCKKL